MHPQASALIGATAPESTSIPQPTILVVDDENTVRAVVSEILRQAGFHVLEAESGMEALTTLERKSRVDLLFTDIRMPGMDGFELAKAAQKLRPGLKVLFTTGYTEQCSAPGIPVLRKPYRVRALVTAVQIAIGAADEGMQISTASVGHQFGTEPFQHGERV